MPHKNCRIDWAAAHAWAIDEVLLMLTAAQAALTSVSNYTELRQSLEMVLREFAEESRMFPNEAFLTRIADVLQQISDAICYETSDVPELAARINTQKLAALQLTLVAPFLIYRLDDDPEVENAEVDDDTVVTSDSDNSDDEEDGDTLLEVTGETSDAEEDFELLDEEVIPVDIPFTISDGRFLPESEQTADDWIEQIEGLL